MLLPPFSFLSLALNAFSLGQLLRVFVRRSNDFAGKQNEQQEENKKKQSYAFQFQLQLLEINLSFC